MTDPGTKPAPATTGATVYRRSDHDVDPSHSRWLLLSPALWIGLAVWMVLGGLLCALIALDPQLAPSNAKVALARTLITLGYSLIALALLVLLLVTIQALAAVWLRRFDCHRERALTGIAVFLLIVLGLNVFPISVYIGLLDRPEWPRAGITAVSLLFANAMLYYFCNALLHNQWTETRRLYAVSGTYKGQSCVSYAREKVRWNLLTNLWPLFFYLFSFTLFVDKALDEHPNAPLLNHGLQWLSGVLETRSPLDGDITMGIVGRLYDIAFDDGFTPAFALNLLTLLLCVLPLFGLFTGCRRWLERSLGMER